MVGRFLGMLRPELVQYQWDMASKQRSTCWGAYQIPQKAAYRGRHGNCWESSWSWVGVGFWSLRWGPWEATTRKQMIRERWPLWNPLLGSCCITPRACQEADPGVCSMDLTAGKPLEGVISTECPVCQPNTTGARKSQACWNREEKPFTSPESPSTFYWQSLTSFQLARGKCSDITRTAVEAGFVAERQYIANQHIWDSYYNTRKEMLSGIYWWTLRARWWLSYQQEGKGYHRIKPAQKKTGLTDGERQGADNIVRVLGYSHFFNPDTLGLFSIKASKSLLLPD